MKNECPLQQLFMDFRRTLGEFYDNADAYWECDQNSYKLRLNTIKKSLIKLMKEY
jgi:hypothetical protein